jgi:hypothetical protein
MSNNKKQRGGKVHIRAIRKDDSGISFPGGFPNLTTNGDYNIIHVHDPSILKLDKLNQLNDWLTATFLHVRNISDIPKESANVRAAYKLSQTQEFKTLMTWLNSPEF